MFRAGTKKTRTGLKFNRSFLYVPVIWNAPLLDKENTIRAINCRNRVIIEWHNYSDLVFRTQTDTITAVGPTWSETIHKADYDTDDHKNLSQNFKNFTSQFISSNFPTISHSATDLYPICRTLHRINNPKFWHQWNKGQWCQYQSRPLDTTFSQWTIHPLPRGLSKHRFSYRTSRQIL